MSTNLAPDEPREIGGYRILRRLGQGGMGVVYLATDATGRRLALKVVHPEWARDPRFRRRFAREVAAARRVARFCTAPVLDADAEAPLPYLVTEYVAGPDLGRAVREQGPLTGADLESLAAGIAVALTAIHGAGVVHRDLKPSNVLLSPTGPRVIDFGIAQLAEPEGLPSRTIMGTPAFMAPEQVRGEGTSAASDVFSWGGLMVFAGTGRLPFGGGPAAEVLYRIVHDGPVLDGLDGRMRELVERALAKRPELRPSARELLAELVGAPAASPETAARVVESTWTGPLSPSAASSAPPGGVPPVSAPTAPAPSAAPAGPASAAARPGVPARPGRARRALVLAAAVAVLGGLGAAGWLRTSAGSGPSLPFHDTFDAADSGWQANTTQGGTAEYAQGAYRLAVNRGWLLWKAAPVGPVGDALLIADADMAGSGAYGVWCAGAAGRYEFVVSTDGTAAITRGGDGRVTLAEPAASDAINKDAANHIVATCRDTDAGLRLQMWVNGELVAEARDEAAKGPGEVGVIAYPAPGETAEARFTDFEVRRP